MTGSVAAPRYTVRVSGVTMAADLADHVLSLIVETDLDVAGSCTFVLHNRDNTLLDSPLLDPGQTVEVHLGYGTDLRPAFLGEIAAIEPSFPAGGPPTIGVTAYDRSYKMRRAQPEPTTYTLMSDSTIAAQIAAEHGLVPIVDPTPGLPDEVTQAESDMAFLKSRAERYFFDVYVEWDRLHFQFPRPQAVAYVLEWGRNLISFSPRISAAGLAGLQVIRGYSQELAQTITVAALAADLDLDNLLERLGSSALDLLGDLVRKGVRQSVVENPLDAGVLARSLLSNLLEGMYEGTGSCPGLPDLAAGRCVAIQGVGRRFSGTYRVRNVVHRLDESGYSTDFSITQRAHTSLMGMLRKQVAEEPSPNRAEKFHGVVIGVVQNGDELSAAKAPTGKVQVRFPWLSETFVSAWAPCARPMGGKDMGFYSQPAPGEQVLVAFRHGELSQPYVLGSLWNATAGPPAAAVEGHNDKRIIRSRAGHTITFDDTADAGTLTVEDGHGSSIVLDASDGSVTISAAGDLTIKANGTISIEAAGGATAISMTAERVNVT